MMKNSEIDVVFGPVEGIYSEASFDFSFPVYDSVSCTKLSLIAAYLGVPASDIADINPNGFSHKVSLFNYEKTRLVNASGNILETSKINGLFVVSAQFRRFGGESENWIIRSLKSIVLIQESK